MESDDVDPQTIADGEILSEATQYTPNARKGDKILISFFFGNADIRVTSAVVAKGTRKIKSGSKQNLELIYRHDS